MQSLALPLTWRESQLLKHDVPASAAAYEWYLRANPLSQDIPDDYLRSSPTPNQSQRAFWNEPSISDSQIFVTASDVWGPDEGHYGEHRYIVSTYLRQPVTDYDSGDFYWLVDRYMTTSFYDLESADVLKSEKPEILARVRGAKAEMLRRRGDKR